MRSRVGAPARVVAVIALLVAAGLPAFEGHQVVRVDTPVGVAPADRATVHGDSNAVHPAAGVPRNLLLDAPCNTTSNAEVVQAFDSSIGYLYEAWIGCDGIGFTRSIDGGYSFDAAMTVPGSANASTWDPAVALAPNGTVYVGYMRNDGSGDEPAVAWSFDHGASFNGWAPAFAGAPTEFSDRDYLAVAPNGTVYLTWDFSPTPGLDQIECPPGGSCYFTAGDFNIVLESSSDGGRTWSAPVPVDPEYPWGGAVSGPVLVEANGAVDVLYEDYNVTPTHVLTVGQNYFTQSLDGGRTFSPPVPVSNLTFANSTWWIDGQVAQDASGTLYATFDAPGVGNDTAYAVVSTTDGVSWSAPIQLTPTSTPSVQALVAVGGGPNGTAYVGWMTNNSSGGWQTYEATLTGNGSALSAPTLVSAGVGIATEWVGDTIGVTDLGGGAIAVSWSYGLGGSDGPGSQVYAAVLGESVPVNPPQLTAIVPGPGEITVGWLPPAGGDRVGGYQLSWGIESQWPNNVTLSGRSSFYTITPLGKGIRWQVEVAATNGAGIGPFTTPVVVLLTAWSVLNGSVTPANALVRLDGVALPVDNGTFSANTTEGSHLLSAFATNYTPLFDSEILPWNSTLTVNLTLSEAPGTLEGYVTPVAAHVTVDLAAVNVSSLGFFEVTPVAPGTHAVTVAFGGYVAFSDSVPVGANATVWENVTLLPVNATLNLAVTPVNATVTVDGRPVHLNATGFGSVVEVPGLHTIEATADGFVPYFLNVTLNTSESRTVAITMTAVPPPNTTAPAPSPPLGGYLLVALAVGVAAAVAIAALVVRRLRGRGAPRSDSAQIWEADDEAKEPESPPAEPPAGGSG